MSLLRQSACRGLTLTSRRRAKTSLALSLSIVLASLRGGSSFLSPGTKATVPSAKTASSSLRSRTQTRPMGHRSSGLPVLSAEAADSTSVEDGADGRTSPSGLSLEGVYKRLKLETLGLDDGTVRLESKDTDFGIEIVKVTVSREPSLGIMLEEVARGGDGRGLVLVSGTVPGGNAESSGNIFAGDTVCWVGVEPDRMERVEALDWDQTMSALGEFAEESEITIVSKRLVKRETIKVEFVLPNGSQDFDIKTGSNLRGEMIRLDVPVYDPQTLRYDQPYATGNCAGEGTCGTCFVEIVEGQELVSPANEEEKMLLSTGNLPVRWRLSCKTIVGRENTSGTVRVKAVPQAQWREQRKAGKT